jgi:cytoskeletal protein CcmA (bactofilin family)
MTDYTKTTNFAAKDSLVSGNPAKVVKGTEVNTEFDNIATAVATKANLAGPTFTGTTTAANLTVSGTFTGTIDGGTY